MDLLVRANRYGDARREFSSENSRNDGVKSQNMDGTKWNPIGQLQNVDLQSVGKTKWNPIR